VALVVEPVPAGKARYMAILALENTETNAVIYAQPQCMTPMIVLD
jgi:hypothetical protein